MGVDLHHHLPVSQLVPAVCVCNTSRHAIKFRLAKLEYEQHPIYVCNPLRNNDTFWYSVCNPVAYAIAITVVESSINFTCELNP